MQIQDKFKNIHFLSPIVKLLSAIILMLIMLLPAGCQKSPINGNLDGQWQVMEVSPEPSETIIDRRLYMCFSLHTVQLTFYGSGPWQSGNILQFSDKTLSLEFPYVSSDPTDKDEEILRQYGINSNPVTFSIERLDSKKLILRDGDTVVTLRKF